LAIHTYKGGNTSCGCYTHTPRMSSYLEVAAIYHVLYVFSELLCVMAVQLQHKLGTAAGWHDLTAGAAAAEALQSCCVQHNVYGAAEWVCDYEVLLACGCR